MPEKISYKPMVLDLILYAGDGPTLKFTVVDVDDAPVAIAGIVEAQIRANRSPTSESIVEFAADLTEADGGIILLSLTGAQTQQLMATAVKDKFTGVWDVEWTPVDSEPRTLCQGKVECWADVTR